jgi:hypothetical protein
MEKIRFMNEHTPIKIEVSGGYCETANLALTLNADSTIDQYVDAFKTILTFLKFHPTNIAEVFGEESLVAYCK